MQRPKRNNNIFKQWVGPLFMITVGAVIAAFALEEFLVPFTILDGGVVGVSMIMDRRGSEEWARLTREVFQTKAMNKQSAIVLDDLV